MVPFEPPLLFEPPLPFEPPDPFDPPLALLPPFPLPPDPLPPAPLPLLPPLPVWFFTPAGLHPKSSAAANTPRRRLVFMVVTRR